MPNKKNILHSTLHLKMGGLETVIMDLCRHGNRDKFQYYVLCLSSCDSSYRRELENYGVPVYIINRNGRYDFMFFFKIITLFKKLKIDVIHAHSGCVFNSLVCGKIAGVSVKLFTEHGLPLFEDGSPMPMNLKTKIEERFIGKIAQQIVGVSNEIQENLLHRFPLSKDKIINVPNGIDTKCFTNEIKEQIKITQKKKYNIPDGKFIIGSVGRLVPVKNYTCLIKSFSILHRNIHTKGKMHLVLVGDGPEIDDLKKMAADLGVLSDISFMGTQYDVENILPLFNVFVLPSITEGTSISLLEAQSCGVPSIVTNVGGNPNIIKDGVNGFLCAVDDSSKMASKIALLFEDNLLAKKMSTHARAGIIQKFSVEDMVEHYEQLYVEDL